MASERPTMPGNMATLMACSSGVVTALSTAPAEGGLEGVVVTLDTSGLTLLGRPTGVPDSPDQAVLERVPEQNVELMPGDVINAIQNQNTEVAAGEVEEAGPEREVVGREEAALRPGDEDHDQRAEHDDRRDRRGSGGLRAASRQSLCPARARPRPAAARSRSSRALWSSGRR